MCNLVFLRNGKGNQRKSDPAIGRAAVTMHCAVYLLKINDEKKWSKILTTSEPLKQAIIPYCHETNKTEHFKLNWKDSRAFESISDNANVQFAFWVMWWKNWSKILTTSEAIITCCLAETNNKSDKDFKRKEQKLIVRLPFNKKGTTILWNNLLYLLLATERDFKS